jgi:hypothetical protein
MLKKSEYKYYESLEYHLVYCELIHAAQSRSLVTYKRVGELMGITTPGNHLSRETGEMIGTISANELEHGRPMLSAIVVQSEKPVPGDGFYNWAMRLNRYDPSLYAKPDDFWHFELGEVYKTWTSVLESDSI